METQASIGRYYFDSRDPNKGVMYALKPTSKKSFIEDCGRTDPYRLRAITRTAKRIYDHGCAYGRASETIKRIATLPNTIEVFEARVKGTVIRVACYIHDAWIPIYLFDFDTHPGSRNNLPAHYIERAKNMATIAHRCAAEYDFSDYGGKR